jgi:hypothetical protein
MRVRPVRPDQYVGRRAVGAIRVNDLVRLQAIGLAGRRLVDLSCHAEKPAYEDHLRRVLGSHLPRWEELAGLARTPVEDGSMPCCSGRPTSPTRPPRISTPKQWPHRATVAAFLTSADRRSG